MPVPSSQSNSDIDQKALERLYAKTPELREWPEDKVKGTYAFAFARRDVALENLRDAIVKTRLMRVLMKITGRRPRR